MSSARILAFAGSTRNGSFNRRAIEVAVSAARDAGAEVTLIDLADYPMPIFDQDLEAAEGLPKSARELKQRFLEHDALLLACPEYNSSITPLLKNVIDWVSRKATPDEAPLACYRGKVAGLIAASPGGLGGLRGLVHVRAILSNIGVTVIPEQHAVASASDVFAEDGTVKVESHQNGLAKVGTRLAEVAAKLR